MTFKIGNGRSKYYSKITVLDIPDIYKYYAPELLKILKQKIIV